MALIIIAIAFPTCAAPCDCTCMTVLSKDLGEFRTPIWKYWLRPWPHWKKSQFSCQKYKVCSCVLS